MIKKTLTIITFIFITAFSPNKTTVYICGPLGAKKYHHSSYCRGLSACKHQINEVSKEKAISLGLALCGWED
ncbi:hypothetical protein [Flavobacterium nackdongense]|uniref:Uncharacterized protein n=1 Tax=Flavobacterium nackdongense TaxID=2547394 RepID=A0A4P6YAM2_9FLAO|nr:hypothetical protein [Flavobacterium nackdongense]QBN17804.1 hypothetical protein E1750_02975 [Flavobacterium nackdongense]